MLSRVLRQTRQSMPLRMLLRRGVGTSSINPATNQKFADYDFWSSDKANSAAEHSNKVFKESWRRSSFDERRKCLTNAAAILRRRKDELCKLMALEMGKPISEGAGEVEKCALICEYFAARAEQFLTPEQITQEMAIAPLPGQKHTVQFNPIGPVLIIMPWNFPLWQVFRQSATALSAGNTMLLKHAPNVFGCAQAIEEIMLEAGFPAGVFQNIPISGEQASELISNPFVRAVALTGSTPVGRKVGQAAGALIKPHVLELGGSDPYLILEDADLELAVNCSAAGRLLNCGQSCIGAKRFIALDCVSEAFTEALSAKVQGVKVGDPMDAATQMGPMVSVAARDNLHSQVAKSVEMGARLVCGGVVPEGPGAFYPPTVLADVKPGMPAFSEELFGPVASIISVPSEEEAIRVANDTSFGLGAAVFTRNLARGERIASEELEAGMCFVNDFVKSHQALPFGGFKESGVGRECADYGIKEFVNIKTVVVGK